MKPSRARGARRRLEAGVAQPDRQTAAAAGLGTWLASAAPRRARGVVSIAIVSDRRMRVLNRTFRGADYPTDVLSFAEPRTPDKHVRISSRGPRTSTVGRRTSTAGPRTEKDAAPRTPDSGPLLGEIVIALGVAGRQAREYGHSLRIELRILALHGLLHLLGYDHERDRGTMRAAEDRLRRRAGLPTGLIARAGRGTVQE
jgi:probable rRNA maturation factor